MQRLPSKIFHLFPQVAQLDLRKEAEGSRTWLYSLLSRWQTLTSSGESRRFLQRSGWVTTTGAITRPGRLG